ncbi:MAG: extracellular solute-binding protein [Roseburia sp.]
MEHVSMNRILSALGLVIFCAILALGAQSPYEPLLADAENEYDTQQEPVPEENEVPEDYELLFWYHDEKCQEFFEQAAADYEEATGVKVKVCYVDSAQYLEEIYDVTMEDGDYPDLYLAGNDVAEKAYLYGIAGKEKTPLYFETVLFVYHEDLYPQQPENMIELLNYVAYNDSPEGVTNILEWNVADGFYDYPFIAGNFELEFTEDGAKIVGEEGYYEQQLVFFGNLAAYIQLDANTITDEMVLEDFNRGTTICAIIGSDDLAGITAEDAVVMELPVIGMDLPMEGCSVQGCFYINDFSKNKQEAQEFINYVVEEKSDVLEAETGHMPVKEDAVRSDFGKVAYRQYLDSSLVPESIHSGSFWAQFENLMMRLWNGENVFE